MAASRRVCSRCRICAGCPDSFGLLMDLRGKRVLDVGAWDGWFSFECERRGAEVVAVDCIPLETFLEAKELIGSKVEYLTLDVNELSARRLGKFDIVLFFGVLYHLRHPLLGLEKVVELSTDLVLIESFVIEREKRQIPAVMEFYEGTELAGQVDNWCGPSPEALLAMCRSAGLAQVELLDITQQRASVIAKRRWPEPDAVPKAAAPHLHAVTNNRTYRSSFHPNKDEYLCCYFRSEERGLTADGLFVEVDGFGTHALTIAATEGSGYQANCLLPPGLPPGRHEVRIRTRHSGRSNAAAFTMLDDEGRDVVMPSPNLPASALELCMRVQSARRSAVCGEPGRFAGVLFQIPGGVGEDGGCGDRTERRQRAGGHHQLPGGQRVAANLLLEKALEKWDVGTAEAGRG